MNLDTIGFDKRVFVAFVQRHEYHNARQQMKIKKGRKTKLNDL